MTPHGPDQGAADAQTRVPPGEGTRCACSSRRASAPALAWAWVSLTTLTALAAPLRLSEFFASDMVLPADRAFAVTGEGAPNSDVALRIGARAELRARADAQGRWRIQVPPTPVSAAPSELEIRSGDECLACTNVLFGDLWLCAGQSNMDLPLSACDTAAQAAAAAADPALRLLRIACRLPTGGQAWSDAQVALSRTPEAVSCAWQTVTPRSAPPLSGVAVMFGQALRTARPGVPLGLVQLAVGGAPVEAFTPAEAAVRSGWLDVPNYPAPWCQARAKANLARASGRDAARHPYEPGYLYDRAVAPLAAQLPVRGVLWYQGESNASSCGTPDAALDPAVMRRSLADLIASWRRAWADHDLPFVLVLLPRMNRPWMLYREQQSLLAQSLPEVGLAVATDTGNPNNVHPADKRLVAARAADEARRIAYREPAAPAVTYALRAAGASPAVIRFTPGHALAVKGDDLAGFELSADGAAYVPARAALRADNTVALSAAGLSTPVAVRYNWAPAPLGNLYNAAGIPVPPFRLAIQHNVQ